MKTDWDYSHCASTYDKRANYSESGIDQLYSELGCSPNQRVADIGAGTGKLTIPLCNRQLIVDCVEPNNNMREIGIKNTKGRAVIWHEGTGENTGLIKGSVNHVFFGSSFSVTNQSKTLRESKDILVAGGGFACLWNHRDLNDPVQSEIENIIKFHVPNYNYGNRRSDPTNTINKSGLFGKVFNIESSFLITMKTADIIDAWRSHNTLYRQSKGQFEKIILEIKAFLTEESYDVPYTTRIWYTH